MVVINRSRASSVRPLVSAFVAVFTFHVTSVVLEAESSGPLSRKASGSLSVETYPAPIFPPVPFEWNVFLGPWHVIGPFPKPQPEGERRGLGIDYLGREPQVRLDVSVQYEGREYRWKRYDRQVLDLSGAFATDDEKFSREVAYAGTRFVSDKAQDAVLAIGSDDGFVAWLNGEKVAEHIGIRGSYLDDDTAIVHLRVGENTLLLKVENWCGPWGAVARLLPPHLEQPLLNFEWTDADLLGRDSNFQLPDLNIDYLDSRGLQVGTQRCSGFRTRYWSRPLYQLYAPAPEPTPAHLRIRIDQVGYAPFEKVASWQEAWRAPVEVAADGVLSGAGHVVDANTGRPIIGARVVSAMYQFLDETSGPDGSFRFEGVSPFFDWVTVSAPGHMARFSHLGMDESLPIEVSLIPGGRTLQGRIIDDQGNPIEGASVWYWSSADDSGKIDVTDRGGRFLLAGIHPSAHSVSVTVQHHDFAPLKFFEQDLGDTYIKEVVYRMQHGAVVTGRVLTQSGSRLLSGVKVRWGERRFGNFLYPDVFTDVDGSYRLTDLPRGPNLVLASSEEFAPAVQQINAEPGYTVEVNFGLYSGQDIVGRVIGSNGKPTARARVTVSDWNGLQTFERETVTDDDGRFVLRHMPPTSITLSAVKDGYVSKRDIQVVSGSQYDIVLQLAPRHTIRIWPKDTDIQQ